MRIAVVHDFVTQRGGAERVVEAWLRYLPDAELYTLTHVSGASHLGLDDRVTGTSLLQAIPATRVDPRRVFPLLPAFARTIRIPAHVDVVLVSSTSVAHHVRCSQPKVVYCHSPARWLWEPEDYFTDASKVVSAAGRALGPAFRTSDKRAARRASSYLANSTTVQARIKRVYNIEAEVVHPPVSIDVGAPSSAVAGLPSKFVLSVGRDRGYKNTRVVEEACRLTGAQLVTVGAPSSSLDGPHVVRLNNVPDDQLRWLYKKAFAYVTASREDFGLTAIEAQAFGTPVVAPALGGFLDTVIDGVNGIFAHTVTPAAFADALQTIQRSPMESAQIKRTTERFKEENHVRAIRGHLNRTFAAPTKTQFNPPHGFRNRATGMRDGAAA